MNTLYLRDPGSKLHLDGGRYRVERQGATIANFAKEQVLEVILYGGTQITTQAMRDLAERGGQLHLVTQNERLIATMQAPQIGLVDNIKAQIHHSDNPSQCLEISKIIVRGKLENSRTVLMRFSRYKSSATVQQGILAQEKSLERITETTDLDSLRGFEGSAARAYFEALRSLIPEEWGFSTRQRRPAPDPINAMLSFGYALIQARVTTGIIQTGLHPSIGFLHVSSGERPALALDLIEEHRAAIVDRLVLSIVQRRHLTPAHFELTPQGARFSKTAQERFIQLLEQRLNSHFRVGDSNLEYRQIFLHQAKAFAAHLRGTKTYQPMRIR